MEKEDVETESLLTVKDVARRLSMSERWVRTLIGSGQIAVVRLSNKVRVRPEVLEAYIEANDS